MSIQVDLYNSTYGNFTEQVLAKIRRETYREDIGQNSWITTDEYDNVSDERTAAIPIRLPG